MQGYLSTTDGDGQVEIDGRAAVYRDPDRGHAVVVETGDREVSLGVADVTVSRRGTDGDAPVVASLAATCVEVHNNGNANGVTVTSNGRTETIPEGKMLPVERDATITVGLQTELELVVERAPDVTNVYHEGSGDVVAGDVTTVDRSTTVTDSVVNRSDISADGRDGADESADSGPTTVTDSVVNRSTVGGADDPNGSEAAGRPADQLAGDDARTRPVCGEHGPYRGSECPKCVASEPGAGDGPSSGRDRTSVAPTDADGTSRSTPEGPSRADSDATGTPSGNPGAETPPDNSDATATPSGDSTEPNGEPAATDETQFCIFCGDEIPVGAAFCPGCGEELP